MKTRQSAFYETRRQKFYPGPAEKANILRAEET